MLTSPISTNLKNTDPQLQLYKKVLILTAQIFFWSKLNEINLFLVSLSLINYEYLLQDVRQ